MPVTTVLPLLRKRGSLGVGIGEEEKIWHVLATGSAGIRLPQRFGPAKGTHDRKDHLILGLSFVEPCIGSQAAEDARDLRTEDDEGGLGLHPAGCFADANTH